MFALGPPAHDVLFNGFGFQVGSQRLYGITEVLARRVWPSYNRLKIDRALRGQINGITAAQIGIQTDTALAQAVRSGVRPFGAQLTGHARNIAKLFGTHAAEPIAAQLPVAMPTKNIGTAIDVVCVQQTGIVLVEVKVVVNENYTFISTGKMSAPLNKPAMENYPMNQYYAQATVAEALFRRTYTMCDMPIRSVIVIATEEGAAWFEIPRFWTDPKLQSRLLTKCACKPGWLKKLQAKKATAKPKKRRL